MSPTKPDPTSDKRRQRKLMAEAKRQAALTGELPHEFLLKVMRGEGILQKFWAIERDKNGREINRKLQEEVIYPPFGDRVDAAKAAAPFFAAKLATQILAVTPGAEVDAGGFMGLDLGGLTQQELSKVKQILQDAMLRGMKKPKDG